MLVGALVKRLVAQNDYVHVRLKFRSTRSVPAHFARRKQQCQRSGRAFSGLLAGSPPSKLYPRYMVGAIDLCTSLLPPLQRCAMRVFENQKSINLYTDDLSTIIYECVRPLPHVSDRFKF